MSPKGDAPQCRPREYPPEVVELARRLYVDEGMTVAEVRAVFPKGYRVQTILERYVPARRPAAKRDQTGPRNTAWKGDEASYDAAHARLGRDRGACVDCSQPATDWSYVGGCADERPGRRGVPYCLHPDHYEARCQRCHHHYDHKGRRPNGQMLAREEVMPNV